MVARKRRNKMKTNSGVTENILYVFRRYSLLSAVLGIVILLVVGLSLVPPQLLKHIVDNYLIAGRGSELLKMAMVYFIILILIGAADVVKEGLLTLFGQKISRQLRESMMEKQERLAASYIVSHETGTIVSRYMNDVDAIQGLFTSGIISMVIDGLKIIGIIVSIFYFSLKLGIMMILLLPIIYKLSRWFQKRMLKAQMENRILVGEVNNHIPETLRNIEMIKSFYKEDYMEKQYDELITENYRAVEKVNLYDSIFSPIILLIKAAVIASMVVMCSHELNLLGISIGMAAAAIELISNIFKPIENLGMELQAIQQAIAGIKRVNEFLAEEEFYSSQAEGKVSLKEHEPVISFKGVSFSYTEGNPVLKNLSFEINKEERVIFTGRTGAGKSTLFKLILGFYPPDEGEVLIGNCPASHIPSREKRKLFGYVEQSFKFVPGNIYDQISLGDSRITREQIRETMKQVGMDDYISLLPKGYETKALECSFSMGQCQLLSIARAMVLNPPMMLLDEITANLDAETEQKILEVLKKTGEGRTIISIMHRLSAAEENVRQIHLC